MTGRRRAILPTAPGSTSRRPVSMSSTTRPTRPRHRLFRILPARQRRLDPCNARDRAQHQDMLRHHDRAAEYFAQNITWSNAQWHHYLRLVAARTETALPRRDGVFGTLSEAGGRQGCRSARLLSRALGLCRFAGGGGGCRADEEPRPGQDRRLHPLAYV